MLFVMASTMSAVPHDFCQVLGCPWEQLRTCHGESLLLEDALCKSLKLCFLQSVLLRPQMLCLLKAEGSELVPSGHALWNGGQPRGPQATEIDVEMNMNSTLF